MRRDNETSCSNCLIPKSFVEYSLKQIEREVPVCRTCCSQRCIICKSAQTQNGNVCDTCSIVVKCSQCQKKNTIVAYSRTQRKLHLQGMIPNCTRCERTKSKVFQCGHCAVVLSVSAYSWSQIKQANLGIVPTCRNCIDVKMTHVPTPANFPASGTSHPTVTLI
jgi:hypothetical protein